VHAVIAAVHRGPRGGWWWLGLAIAGALALVGVARAGRPAGPVTDRVVVTGCPGQPIHGPRRTLERRIAAERQRLERLDDPALRVESSRRLVELQVRVIALDVARRALLDAACGDNPLGCR
jgi:hypothetical protein